MQRRHSLKKSAEFQRVRSLKRSWTHPLLVLYAAPNGLGSVRLGIVAGKRIGNAVARNRIKRQIREAVRAVLTDLASGHDLVFVARQPAAGAEFALIKTAVESLLLRGRLLSRRAPLKRDGQGSPDLSSAQGPKTEAENHEMDRAASD